jgi:uridine kinase
VHWSRTCCQQEDDLRIQRLIQRHIQFGKTPAEAKLWVRTVDEKNARLVLSTRDHADLVVTVGETRP